MHTFGYPSPVLPIIAPAINFGATSHYWGVGMPLWLALLVPAIVLGGCVLLIALGIALGSSQGR